MSSTEMTFREFEEKIEKLEVELALWKGLATDYHKMAIDSIEKLDRIAYLPEVPSIYIGEWCIESS